MIFLIFTLCSSYEFYKKCKDMTFCRENIDRVSNWTLQNCTFDNNEFTGLLYKNGIDDEMKLVIYLMQSNSFRVTFLPTNEEKFPRYKLSENSYVVDRDIINRHLPLNYVEGSDFYNLTSELCYAEIYLSPFQIVIADKNNSKITINQNQNLVFDHTGQQVPPDLWPYYRNDTIKNGLTTAGVDFSFKGSNTRISGFAEADNSINFEDTKDEPRRVSNIDSFSDYGHIPLVYGHSSTEMISFFWLNPTDTFLKIKTSADTRDVRVLSEGGFIDTVVFTGGLYSILDSYTLLTGRHEIPPVFTLGYHQSKWGYLSQAEVETIVRRLNETGFPLDVLWLDVDHLHNHQPFRFNRTAFPNPDKLFKDFEAKNRYVIRLNDPHLPQDPSHEIAQYALENGYYVNESDGVTPFNGSCWPGYSHWPDFLNPTVHDWWTTLFPYKANETAKNVYFWNDMNEPSVFESVEGTFPKDLLYYGGYEAREIRSLYGLLMHSATYEGILKRDSNTRPFILTRSFFAGSQKYTWMWSGDNSPKYDHLKHSVPMAIVAGLCGMPLTGSDLGGFSSSTTPELISRWYQAALFGHPLFRNHCADLSSHREPYLFDEPYQSILRNVTIMRYNALSIWYTAVHRSHKTGVPPVLPLFAFEPNREEFHDVDDEYIFADALLVAPVLEKGATTRKIVKPTGNWYNLSNGDLLTNDTVEVFSNSLPVFVKGGRIVPFYGSVGESVEDTRRRPLTLIVACDENGNATGSLYIDDGISYNYRNGEFMNRNIVFKDYKISFNVADNEAEKSLPEIANQTYINKIIVYGIDREPEKINSNTKIIKENNVYILYNFKLFPHDGSNEEIPDGDSGDDDSKNKNKWKIYVIIGAVALVVVIIIIVVALVVSRKSRNNKYSVENHLNIDKRNLIDST